MPTPVTLPLPAVGAVAASPATAAGVAKPLRRRTLRTVAAPAATASSSPSTSTSAVSSSPPSGRHSRKHLADGDGAHSKPTTKPRVFFLDVNPLCFRGSQRSLSAFARWLALFFAHVSLRDPVVAVLDGDGGNDYRRRLLPSYKAHRARGAGTGADSRVVDVLRECNVPVGETTWCFMGDEADGVPGIQHLVPGFGRKTAVKLLQKHGSLENLLKIAAIGTVGKDYAQDALTKHADYLRKNYEVLSLKRDVNVQLDDSWLSTRNTCNDTSVLADFILKFNDSGKS
nr:unnamed protein product [Digitaria exilis]